MKPFATQSRYPMIPFEEAIRIIERHIAPLPPRRVPLEEAVDLVLAEDIHAPEPLPAFAAATMDGYAVLAADGTKPRRVLGEQEAGNILSINITPGTCMRIMTGAPVPSGADAVIPVEWTHEQEGWMHCQRVPVPGQNIRPAGADISAGQKVLSAGTVLGPSEIGVLASLGVMEPLVHPRPRVAILATGDELVGEGQPLTPGKIRDSNSYALVAAVRSIGCYPYRVARIADTKEALRDALQSALGEADLIITTGGVSMGTRDFVKPVLEELGTVHFGNVATKPGKPLTFATVSGVPVIGLPGNPVSTLVGFEMVIRPALRLLANRRARWRPEREVRLSHSVRRDPERLEFQRAIVYWEQGTWWAKTTGAQSSSRLLSLVGANALLRIPQGVEDLPAEALVRAIMIHEPEIEQKP